MVNCHGGNVGSKTIGVGKDGTSAPEYSSSWKTSGTFGRPDSKSEPGNGNSASSSTFSSRIFISSGILQVEWSQILSGLIVIFHNILNREAQVTYHSLSTR